MKTEKEKSQMRKTSGLIITFSFILISAFSLPPAAPAQSGSKGVAPQALCARVSKIKEMPFKEDSRPTDENYRALIEAGEAVLPCLIDKVTDEKPMRDPRRIPGPTDTKVGDVAYFVLLRIAKLNFTALLPAEVQEEYRTEGVYAYHRYVGEKSNRRQLQRRLREWHRANYGA